MNPQFASGEIVTAAKLNQLAKGALGSAQVTTAQSGIGTTDTDLTGLSVTVNVVGGRRIRVIGHIRTNAGAVGRAFLRLKEGSTELNSSFMYHSATGAGGHMQHTSVTNLTPTAGSHTYKLTLAFETGTGSMVAAANQPCSITVEDIGGTA